MRSRITQTELGYDNFLIYFMSFLNENELIGHPTLDKTITEVTVVLKTFTLKLIIFKCQTCITYLNLNRKIMHLEYIFFTTFKI